MSNLLLNNYLLFVNLAIPFLIGIYLVITNSKYSLKEFGIQITLTFCIIIGAFSLGYVASDIYTKSYKTTKINKFIYEESWTEKVTYQESYSCGKDGKNVCYRTKVRYDYHPDYYYYVTNDFVDTKTITKTQYLNAKKDFGEILTKRTQVNQSSYGDGKIYDVIPNENIVHGKFESGLNYIYASKTNIIKSTKLKDLEKKYKSELKEYPNFYSEDKYGNMNYSRIINEHLISESLRNKLEKDLEQLSIDLDTNPMIYLTTSPIRDFAYVVKGFYKDMYFNDAMLIIGVGPNDSINWIEPISLSKSADFKVHNIDLTNNFEDLIVKFKDNINKYWIKPNLEDYSYLAGDINIPLWYEILIVLFNIVGSFFVFRYMFKHEI